MDFKIKITCHKCHCCFELRSCFFKETKISCPCCSSEVPEDINTNIMTGMKALCNVPEDYSTEDGCFISDGFSFKIAECS